MAIDLGQLYNQYLMEFQDPVKASQYTAFQFISNPRGSVSGLKKPPTWYSQTEWYDYEAPDYIRTKQYTGDDKLSAFTRDNIDTLTSLADVSAASRRAAKEGYLTGTGLTSGDYYEQLKDIYYQKGNAEKKYKAQRGSHIFSQYGLDPETRYDLVTDPNKNTVAYKPAVDYINKKGTERYNTLIKRGVSAQNAKAYTEAYVKNLGSAVIAKINAAGINPFVDQVYAKVKVRK
jgi:hypothetical protein